MARTLFVFVLTFREVGAPPSEAEPSRAADSGAGVAVSRVGAGETARGRCKFPGRRELVNHSVV